MRYCGHPEAYEGPRGPLFPPLGPNINKQSDCPKNPAHLPPPHRLTREDVREYLLYLVDAGLSSSTVSNHLAAIRTAFDKFCLRQVTFGMVVPRKPKRLPVILSSEEVIALLQAAPSLRDKLLLGLMYRSPGDVDQAPRAMTEFDASQDFQGAILLAKPQR